VYEAIEKNPEKIEKLLDEKKLGKWIVGMITNQLKSNTSSFAKLYYNKFYKKKG
jgi:Asp-tRNA(Asn)/Glu-tRNA(Gln) amidotransferase B subunit